MRKATSYVLASGEKPVMFDTRVLSLPAILLAVIIASIPAAGLAETVEDWLKGDNMTGDWGGVRSKLHEAGVDPTGSFVGEFAGNPTGGRRQGASYDHEIDFGADFDLEKLLQLHGTTFHFLLAEYAGKSLSDDRIGNLFQVQEVFDGKPDTRLANLSIEQNLSDGGVNIKVGRFSAGDDFALVDVAKNFQSGGIQPVPAALTMNSGFTTAPIPSWGGRIKTKLSDTVFVQAGAYEVNPTLAEPSNGFKLSTSGATGAIVPVEIDWNPTNPVLKLPGEYRFGGYYDSSDVKDISSAVDEAAPTRHGRWGLYFLGQQAVYREAANSSRGLTVFAGGEFGDPFTAEIEWFLEAGLVYQGTFAGRDNDTVNLAIVRGWINNRLIDAQEDADRLHPDSEVVQSAETVIELNYGAEITPWFTLRPGFQFVFDAGGYDNVPTAVVLGLQSSVTF
jgi:porin